MADIDHEHLIAFLEERSGEEFARELEGPARLGDNTVWRAWTYDGEEYHAHYIIAQDGVSGLAFKRDFAPFAIWLTSAFDAKDSHQRRLDLLRTSVAAGIIFALLVLTIWAAVAGQAENIDYRWLVGALGAASVAYLLGEWTRRR